MIDIELDDLNLYPFCEHFGSIWTDFGTDKTRYVGPHPYHESVGWVVWTCANCGERAPQHTTLCGVCLTARLRMEAGEW